MERLEPVGILTWMLLMSPIDYVNQSCMHASIILMNNRLPQIVCVIGIRKLQWAFASAVALQHIPIHSTNCLPTGFDQAIKQRHKKVHSHSTRKSSSGSAPLHPTCSALIRAWCLCISRLLAILSEVLCWAVCISEILEKLHFHPIPLKLTERDELEMPFLARFPDLNKKKNLWTSWINENFSLFRKILAQNLWW